MTERCRIERRAGGDGDPRPAGSVRNAVDPATAAALAEAFREFERDEAVRVAVLWGAGGTFCAGADLKAVAAGWDPSRLQRAVRRRRPTTGRWARPGCSSTSR